MKIDRKIVIKTDQNRSMKKTINFKKMANISLCMTRWVAYAPYISMSAPIDP